MKVMYLVRGVLGALAMLLGLAGLIIVGLSFPKLSSDEPVWGVTFSVWQAEHLGLNWQEVYQQLLTDLGVRQLRLSAYWNVIEPVDDQYDFSGLDYQMDMAAAHEATVVLGVGRKLPRWPECHEPDWVRQLSEAEKQTKILEMLTVVVERYREHPALGAWQLENEPLFFYGVCPEKDVAFLGREEQLVRVLDGGVHQIMVTDSGELSSWLPAAQFGDLLGTTMYRTVFSQRTQRRFDYDYIFPAGAYRLKARYIKLLTGKDVIISELQGEPWGQQPVPQMSAEERAALFSPDRLSMVKKFAQKTGFPVAYWWGVEYWYWEKTKQGNDEYWEVAKEMFD